MSLRNIFSLLFSGIFLYGQFSITGSAQLRFGESKNGYSYSETLLNVNTNWGKTAAWFQFEFSDPPELGNSFSGLRKFRLNYSTDHSLLSVGDLYEIWGRGLVLNQIDDQVIDLDNGVTGLSYLYQIKFLKGQILAGETDILKIVNLGFGLPERKPNFSSHHNIAGADFEVGTASLTLGISFLQSREKHPSFNSHWLPDTLAIIHRLTGARLAINKDIMDSYFEYVNKVTLEKYMDFMENSELDTLVNRGNGFYGNINIYPGVWSIMLDYKNFNYSHLDPDSRNYLLGDPFDGSIDFQRPPFGLFEHSTHLLNRITHQVDYSDERGFQIEVFGPVKEWFTLLLHYARGSRNYSWKKHLETYEWTSTTNQNLIPTSDPSAYPYEEFYTEVDGYLLQQKLHYYLGFGKTRDIPVLIRNTLAPETQSLIYELIEGITIPTLFEYYAVSGWSLEMKAEYQRLSKGSWHFEKEDGVVKVDSLLSNFGSQNDYQINTFFSIGIGKSPHWSAAFIIDAASVLEGGDISTESFTNPLEQFLSKFMDINRKWVSVELLYNITTTHQLTLMYGSQQGGLLCNNGVCRIIEPFDDGFKLTLTALF